MSVAPPRASVIIPSRNRRQSLLRVLAALAQQDCGPEAMEVVVGLNACSDGSAAALAGLSTPFRLAVVETARAGAGSARNAAAHVAAGDILIFLDDDIDPAPFFVSAHLEAHGQGPGIVCIGHSRPCLKGSGYFDLQKRAWWSDVFRQMAEPHHRFSYRDLLSGNFSVSSGTFRTVGGFDEQLNCREDYELGVRLLKVGASFTYSGRALGDHRDDSTLARSFQRTKLEGAADMRLLLLHPELPDELRALRARRLFRLMGIASPWTASVEPIVLRFGMGMLWVLERLHFRLTWHRLQMAFRRLMYVHGVAAIRVAPPERDGATPAVSYDLAAGLAAIGGRLDAEAPSAASFDLNRIPVCSSPGAGFEPLRARHLPGLLASHRDDFAVALACERVFGAERALTGFQGCPGVGEIDIADWRLRDSTDVLAQRLLVRNGARPIGWLRDVAQPPAVASEARVEIARQLPLALCAEATRLEFAAKPAPSPSITVVVCTRDRLENLKRCLGALRVLDYPNYQVLVVDNAPADDGTERYVRGLGWARYVREPRPGLDWARNRGVAEAGGDLIAFTDDDTLADRHWLTAIAEAFEPIDVQAVTGFVAPLRLDTPARVYFEDVYGGMGKGFSPVWRRAGAMRPGDLLWASAFGVGANMAFRRSLFEEIGGFDVALDVGTATRGGGDLEFFHRVVSSGRTLLYQPTALIWHEHRGDWEGLRHQLEDNGCGFASYLLAVWRSKRASTSEILEFVLRQWIGRWLLARLLRPGPHYRRLVLAEIRGALRGLGAYRRSLGDAARLRAPAPEASA